MELPTLEQIELMSMRQLITAWNGLAGENPPTEPMKGRIATREQGIKRLLNRVKLLALTREAETKKTDVASPEAALPPDIPSDLASEISEEARRDLSNEMTEEEIKRHEEVEELFADDLPIRPETACLSELIEIGKTDDEIVEIVKWTELSRPYLYRLRMLMA